MATRLRTNKFGHFMVLKGTNILLSLKLKLIMKIKVKFPILKIINGRSSKSLGNEVLKLFTCPKNGF
jgi:hypothetical protein